MENTIKDIKTCQYIIKHTYYEKEKVIAKLLLFKLIKKLFKLKGYDKNI